MKPRPSSVPSATKSSHAAERTTSSPLAELLVAGVLCLVIAFSWCTAYNKWNPAAWNLPTAYLDAYRGDVMHAFALTKAVEEGAYKPFAWKLVPRIGAPFTGSWNDWPLTEEFQIFAQGLQSRWIGVFASLNLALLLFHLLAGLSMFVVARVSGVSRLFSFVAGLAFALAPFIFFQSPHHITTANVWQAPLFLLVWRWISTGDGIKPGSPQFWTATAVAFIAGFHNVYYTNILCQFTLLGAGILALRQKSWNPLIPGVYIVAAAALAFALMQVDTWTYTRAHGANPGALVREYKWLEIYGLKIVDFIIPYFNHHSSILGAFALKHRQVAPLQDEGSYLGIVGLASLILLAAMAARAIHNGDVKSIPTGAWQVLWIILFFSTGGFNAILGAFGMTLFRTGCRYSIVVMAIALLFAAQWLSAESRRHKWLAPLSAVLLIPIIFWDQIPKAPSLGESNRIAAQVQSDSKFAQDMENALPPGSMVFQLPYMVFPESPIMNMPSYDHFRPYIHSKTLRFSFGTDKGRPRDNWAEALLQSPLPDIVSHLEAYGFAAIYVNRNGFQDKGERLRAAFIEVGRSSFIDSPAGDLFCVLLNASPNPRLPGQ